MKKIVQRTHTGPGIPALPSPTQILHYDNLSIGAAILVCEQLSADRPTGGASFHS